jgi:hypothetical protein
MPKKHHSMWQAPSGAVFAILIEPGCWGILRFFRGCSMGVMDLLLDSPVLPVLDWTRPPVKWVFFSFAPDSDPTEAVPVGVVPFEDVESEWGPPCFDPPDQIDNCYRIRRWGMIGRTKRESDVREMARCRRMTPAKLAEFLRERLATGELRPFTPTKQKAQQAGASDGDNAPNQVRTSSAPLDGL